MTEKEVRDIVKQVIKSQMTNMTSKSEVKKITKEESKGFMTEKEVREMIKKTMLSYHKWMWEKKSMWMSQI